MNAKDRYKNIQDLAIKYLGMQKQGFSKTLTNVLLEEHTWGIDETISEINNYCIKPPGYLIDKTKCSVIVLEIGSSSTLVDKPEKFDSHSYMFWVLDAVDWSYSVLEIDASFHVNYWELFFGLKGKKTPKYIIFDKHYNERYSKWFADLLRPLYKIHEPNFDNEYYQMAIEWQENSNWEHWKIYPFVIKPDDFDPKDFGVL